MPKVIVIGLDGAGFNLLDKWLNDDDLPNLSNLMNEGVWQRLKSSYPPVTSPAWRCYSTGVNPGKHGVFWWEQFDRETRTLNVPDSTSYDANNIWDYLGDDGFTSAVVNMPTTYPPEELSGWMVSGGGFEENYTYPADLQEELKENIEYQNYLTVPKQTIKEYPERITEVNDLIDLRFRAAEYLSDTYDPDFLHLSLFITNAIQHYVWGGDALKRMWKCVDQNIGELVEEDDNVIIMSDHGSVNIDTVFNINTWLEKNGFLKTKTSKTDWLYKAGIDKEALIRYTEILGVKEIARRIAPKNIIKQIPDSQGGVGRDAKERKVIWDETEAFASGQGPIYILAEDSRKDEIKSEIKAGLEALTSPQGSPVAKTVHEASHVYDGPYVEGGPDLVVEQAEGVHIPDVVGSPNLFVDPSEWKWDSENHQDGLFIARGPDVASFGKLESKPTLYDLAPTILHWYETELPDNIDGTVLKNIFEDGSDPAQRPPEYVDKRIHKSNHREREEKSDEMMNRLQDLGYLSK